MKLLHRSTLVKTLIASILLFSGGYSSAQFPTSFPTKSKFEVLQDESSDWWHSLRVTMVPGVSYRLQKSESMEPGSWENIFSQYGTDGEWICPLFEGQAPEVPASNSAPSIPSSHAPALQNIYLVVEKDEDGDVLLSWNSLDDQMPKRARLNGVILDPVWEEFDTFYMNPHGEWMFFISPRLHSPIGFGTENPVLGPSDAAMVQGFTAAIPAITTNFYNSVSAAANYIPVPSNPKDRAFFRVAADWTLDSDGDGRFDWQEIIFDGSNPFAADSNGDGILDVAQDNSGPEPSLGLVQDANATIAAAAAPMPPTAKIEVNRIYAYRSETNKPNDPDYISVPTVYALGYSGIEFLHEKRTFSSFVDAVGELPLLDNKWETWAIHFDAEYYKSEPTTGNLRPEDNGVYFETFIVNRHAFRLRLDAPAPPGGYSIPLRIVRYVTHSSIWNSAGRHLPFTDITYQDLILEVAEGQMIGTPVSATVPDLGPNMQVRLIPSELSINSSNFQDDPNYIYRNRQGGFCFLENEGMQAGIFGHTFSKHSEIELIWQKRRLAGDGTLGQWETMERHLHSGESEPPANFDSWSLAYLSSKAGIFQLQAVYLFPDGTKIPIPYLRMADGKNIQDGADPPNTNFNLKAGQPDYIGVCRNELSLNVRDQAVRWLGSTAYAQREQVSIKAGYIYNPDTKGANKCNLFVTHISNRVGATTPFFYRHWGIVPTAPIAKEDWHLDPEKNVDLDPPGWFFKGPIIEPAPGMIAASYGTASRSGHVGIVDYDGSWIAAGSKRVNKYIHLSDEDSPYKPTNFRSR